MEELARDPKRHSVAATAWTQFKADLMTEWYRDYRKVIEDEWSKNDPSRKVALYATSQTLAHGAGEVELHSIMRDNAARLSEGILQGLLPMPYFYDSYYGGSLRKVGDDLMQLQKMWGSHTKGAPALLPYLLSGGGWMCYVEPARGLKYQVYEAFTTGAVSGCIFWNLKGMNGYHWKHLAGAIHTLAKVEHILRGGVVEELPCAPPEARARAVRNGDESVIFVSHYGGSPVEVVVSHSAKRSVIVENAETGEKVMSLPAGRQELRLTLNRERVLLLRTRPAVDRR
jgi:hypothetical protein